MVLFLLSGGGGRKEGGGMGMEDIVEKKSNACRYNKRGEREIFLDKFMLKTVELAYDMESSFGSAKGRA